MNPARKKIKKVFLLFPPVVFSEESPCQIMPPLGISYLAAFLRDDYEVQMLDAAVEGYAAVRKLDNGFLSYGLSVEQIGQRIAEFAPDVVGISCAYSSPFAQVLQICAQIKRISKDIITVLGGTHPTFFAREALSRFPDINFIVLSEGEQAMKDLLDGLNQGINIETIAGIAGRSGQGISVNSEVSFIEDLDKIPFPARQLLPLEKYFRIGLPMGLVSRREPAMNMITSRGCSFHCSFCSSSKYWGRCYRKRSPENVLNEMQELKNMGIKELKFFDDNLTLDPARAKAIFRGMIERKFKFTWNTPNGIAAQTLDEEMVLLMKESGCYEITLAVESGDETILRDVLHKPVNLDATLKTARMIKSHGLDTYGFFIIGFPRETKENIRRTLAYMEKIKLDRVSLFIANPLPGTEIYEECVSRGYISRKMPLESLDYFRAKFKTPEFDQKYLEDLRRRWYWSYNLKLILRNPFKFFRKYYKFIFKQPWFLLRLLFSKLFMPMLRSCK